MFCGLSYSIHVIIHFRSDRYILDRNQIIVSMSEIQKPASFYQNAETIRLTYLNLPCWISFSKQNNCNISNETTYAESTPRLRKPQRFTFFHRNQVQFLSESSSAHRFSNSIPVEANSNPVRPNWKSVSRTWFLCKKVSLCGLVNAVFRRFFFGVSIDKAPRSQWNVPKNIFWPRDLDLGPMILTY